MPRWHRAQLNRGVMGRISIHLVADDMAMPEQSELAVFSGDVREYVREHWDYFLELVESNPELGYKSIGRKLQERLGESLSTAHLQVVRRIMNELPAYRAAGVERDLFRLSKEYLEFRAAMCPSES